jgi:hypothetical protein
MSADVPSTTIGLLGASTFMYPTIWRASRRPSSGAWWWGNPPHYPDDDHIGDLRGHDPEWRIHRTFLAQVGAHLRPGGVIVLQENSQGSTAETFGDMISAAGLEIAFVEFGPRQRMPYGHIYYIGIVRRGDEVPTWARGTLCA